MRMAGLVDGLCGSLEHVTDQRFAATVGRITSVLHGEQSAAVLQPHIARSEDPGARARLLFALGATSTEGALATLTAMRAAGGDDAPSVEAALRKHGSRRAMKVIEDAKRESSK